MLRKFGAQERTRTSTTVRPLAPEASASASSATWALHDEGLTTCCCHFVLSAANFQVPRRIRPVTFLRDVVAAEYQVRFVTRSSPSNITRHASPNQVSNRARRKSCSNSLMLADSQRVDQALRQFLYRTAILPREDMSRERAEMPTTCDQQHRLHLRCRSRIPATA